MDEVKKNEEVVKGLDKLPTLPDVASRTLEAVKNEDTCLKEISDTLSSLHHNLILHVLQYHQI